jgi:activating signal cointegrator complex subunit 3
MLRVFAQCPSDKVLYIAPLKALVRERIREWRTGLCAALRKRLAELTGDHTPDLASLLAADVIVSTPEKWDGISRSWQSRGYVRMVRLVIIDEVHLLGSERGAVLEAIVSRMRFVAERMNRPVRFVGLSTALANPHDLASWLGINSVVRWLGALSSTAFLRQPLQMFQRLPCPHCCRHGHLVATDPRSMLTEDLLAGSWCCNA